MNMINSSYDALTRYQINKVLTIGGLLKCTVYHVGAKLWLGEGIIIDKIKNNNKSKK